MSERFAYGARVWVAGRAGVVVGYDEGEKQYSIIWRNVDEFAAQGMAAHAVSGRADADAVDKILAINGGVKMAEQTVGKIEQLTADGGARFGATVTYSPIPMTRAELEALISASVQEQLGALTERVAALEEAHGSKWTIVSEEEFNAKLDALNRGEDITPLGTPQPPTGDDNGRVTVDGVPMTAAQYAALKDLVYEAVQAMQLGDNLSRSLEQFGAEWHEMYWLRKDD